MISAYGIPLDELPQGPVTSYRCRVEESWIDFNDHMNAMYYGIVVYQGQEKFSELIGMGADYADQTGLGKVIVQSTRLRAGCRRVSAASFAARDTLPRRIARTDTCEQGRTMSSKCHREPGAPPDEPRS